MKPNNSLKIGRYLFSFELIERHDQYSHERLKTECLQIIDLNPIEKTYRQILLENSDAVEFANWIIQSLSSFREPQVKK
jgi:hypothetical protein